MSRGALVALLALTAACAPAPDDGGGGAITGACTRSFRPTLEAWEAEFGRVPDECAYLDNELAVEVVAEADMPCDDPVGVNQVRTECFQGGVIYINRALDELARVDASVHGWVHGLTRCVDGTPDLDHLRAALWYTLTGADSVEVQAQASAEIGACL